MVSVIIPVLNERTGLERLLQGLVRQRYRPLEIIVVDGGSTDGGPELVSSRASEALTAGVTIRLLKESDFGNQRSPANARNLGVTHSNGGFIIFLDGDFEVDDEDLVAEVAQGLRRYESVGVYIQPADSLWLEYHSWVDRYSRTNQGVAHTFCGYARNVFTRGLFDTSLGFGEDMEFHSRVNPTHGYINRTVGRHFVHTPAEWRKQMIWYGRTYPHFVKRAGKGAFFRLLIWCLPLWLLILGLGAEFVGYQVLGITLVGLFLLSCVASFASSHKKDRLRLAYVFLAKTYALLWLSVGLCQYLFGVGGTSRS